MVWVLADHPAVPVSAAAFPTASVLVDHPALRVSAVSYLLGPLLADLPMDTVSAASYLEAQDQPDLHPVARSMSAAFPLVMSLAVLWRLLT
jgi:hypothetical protein